MATDPVCGMWVEERSTSLRLERQQRTYYFCSEGCLHQFAEPERAERRLLQRVAVAWPLTIAVVILVYAVPSLPSTVGAAILAAVVQFYPGATFYSGSADAVRDRSWNMDVLIALGSTVAFGYSVAALALPTYLPHDYFFDASALIVTLILTGQYLEHRTRARAGSALARLGELLPSTALVVREGAERSVPLGELRPGERVRVLPGGRFPVDGTVRSGTTQADESLLTGESLSVPKHVGDRVYAGAVNGEGAVEVEATAVGSDTFVSEVGRLLTDAEMSRVPLKRVADRIASVFVPTVLALALVAAVFWLTVGGAGATIAILVFVTVTITACPCSFGIATPAALWVGAGRAAESGVLFRGEDTVERAARIDVVVTDKTGTLTRGRPSLVEIAVGPSVTDAQALAYAAAVESGSEHPLARAVLQECRHRGISFAPAREIRAEPGVGVSGQVDGHRIELIRSPDPPSADARSFALADGLTVAELRRDGAPLARFGFRDEPTPSASPAIAELRRAGVRVVIATGDTDSAAGPVARALGITELHAGLTPAGKLALLRSLQADGHRVAFVGDGINDAPALAAADVGIAIGSGTDVAREAGGILLVRSDLRGVPFALGLARRTVAKVRGNLAWAVGYNLVLLPVAMGVLVPWLGLGVYSVLPIVGALAMALSSTAVVLNSISLRWARLTPGAA